MRASIPRSRFLSTLSLRRATTTGRLTGAIFSISIHALLAESDGCGACRPTGQCISIHALLAESDRTIPRIATTNKHFYPRSPCGERLLHPASILISRAFLSTLSLRRATVYGFPSMMAACLFLSTLSLRRATAHNHRSRKQRHQFLSTLSLRRATIFQQFQAVISINFYPRSPCGERPR